MHHLRSATAGPNSNSAGGSPAADPLAYTLDRAAAARGLSRSPLYRPATSGRLRPVRVGGRALADGASLRALVGASA